MGPESNATIEHIQLLSEARDALRSCETNQKRLDVMQRKISLWRQWADYRDAQAIAIYQNDPALAAHALRDLPLTDEADLADLCQALHQGGTVSKGDWRGLSELWEKAWRLAMVAVNQEEQSNAL